MVSTTPETGAEGAAAYEGPIIAIPVYAGVSELELGLFVTVCRLCGGEHAARTVNRSRASIVSAGGLVMTPHFMYATLPEPAALLIPGGPGASKAARDPLLKGFLLAHQTLPTGIGGSGALLYGETGLLAGRTIGGPAELQDTLWGYQPDEILAGEVVQDGQLLTTPSGLPALKAALHVATAIWGAKAAAEAVGRLGNGM